MERDWRNFSLQTLDEDVANVGFNAVFFLLSFLNPRINAITITHRFDLEAWVSSNDRTNIEFCNLTILYNIKIFNSWRKRCSETL